MQISVHAVMGAVMGGVMMLATTGTAQADYPTQPVRMVVPFAPGGPADAIGRVIAHRLSEELGQPVVIENRGGAGGMIGTDYVAKGRPDGHLIAMTSAGALTISAAMQPDVPFDNATDFTPLMLLATVPELLVARPDLGVADLAGLVAQAEAAPGQLNYASSGIGSMPHLAGELLGIAAQIDMVHVPYAGAGPAVTDLLGGQVDVMFADSPVLLPHVASGGLVALAVGSPERMALLPGVPTMAEAGLPEVVAENWYGIVAPAGLPQPVSDRLVQALSVTIADPAVAEAMRLQGVDLVGDGPETFGAFIASETAKWADVVARSGAADDRP